MKTIFECKIAQLFVENGELILGVSESGLETDPLSADLQIAVVCTQKLEDEMKR